MTTPITTTTTPTTFGQDVIDRLKALAEQPHSAEIAVLAPLIAQVAEAAYPAHASAIELGAKIVEMEVGAPSPEWIAKIEALEGKIADLETRLNAAEGINTSVMTPIAPPVAQVVQGA